MKWHLVYFVQGFMHPLWWLQSPEIITCNSVLVPLGHGMDKRDEHWSKTKQGDDGMRKGIKNVVTSDDFRTLKPP